MEQISGSTIREDEGVTKLPEVWTHEEIALAHRFAKTLIKLKLCRGHGTSERFEYGKIMHRKPKFLGNEADDEDNDW